MRGFPTAPCLALLYKFREKYGCVPNVDFHISFFKALLINEGETTQVANGIRGETTRYRFYRSQFIFGKSHL